MSRAMTDIELLLAIEGVKKTNATYCYALDTKRWALLETTFAQDAIVDFRGGRDLKPGESHDRLAPAVQALADGDPAVVQGASAIATFMRDSVGAWVTVHQIAAPVIEITDPEAATAIWPLFDILDNGKHVQAGYGHYNETYRREDGVWRIASLHVSRLRLEGDHPMHSR